jgi:hypothetical protein
MNPRPSPKYVLFWTYLQLSRSTRHRRSFILSFSSEILLNRDRTGIVEPHVDRVQQVALQGARQLRGSHLQRIGIGTLRANDLIWRYVVDSYLKGTTPDAFDLLYWDSDSVSLPGPMYCWYTRNTYLENNIKEPGKTTQCGVPIDLSKVMVPLAIDAGAAINSTPSINGGQSMVWCDAFSALHNVCTVHRRPIQIEQLGLI